MRISVVIPAFNNWRLTDRCVDALLAATPAELLAEIVVVDDHSTDGVSAAWTATKPRIVPLLLERNHGFSGACNAGAARCTGAAIVFLNNDAFARPNALQAMCDVLAGDDGIGIVGARLLYSDGSLQHAGLALLPGAVSRWWHIHKRRDGTLPDANVARDFLAVTGAALMIRRDLFTQLDGFDEGFVNGWEDVDLCLRAWCAGKRVRYEPRAVLEHLESATLGRNHDHERNERRFIDRWETLLADAPRYPLAEVPPIALAVAPAPAAKSADAWALAHVLRWWKAHLGAAVMRTRPGSHIDRARVELLAAIARRRPTLEISWGDACLSPATGRRRVAFVAPDSPAQGRLYAQARNVCAWWTPTEAARDALVEAGMPPAHVTVVRLGTDASAPAARSGVPVIAIGPAGGDAVAALPAFADARVVTFPADAPPNFNGVDIVVAAASADRWGLLLPAALGSGCSIVASAPVDTLAAAAPGVTIVPPDGLYDAAAAKAAAIVDVREIATEQYLDARRRLDAYLATQLVSELARAITGGTPGSALVEVDAAYARRLHTAHAPRSGSGRFTIAAHLIVGRNEESFIPALFRSFEDVVEYVVVNDNSEEPDGPNARALAASSFARRGALLVDSAPFVDFGSARNRTLALHREHNLGEWAAFVDADEVHRPIAATIARNLATLPDDIAIVDGYTRHYFQSFRLYTSIERRMTFFRVTPQLHWTGRVHERLAGVAGRHLAIPYVYDHYGAVFSLHRQAAKGRQYSSLGQAGPIVAEQDEPTVRDVDYFRALWPLVLHYHGDHPQAVADVRARLESTERERYLRSARIAAEFQLPHVRAANVIRRANFEYRWRGRALDPRARKLMYPNGHVLAHPKPV
jgi:GT2 family glycosyltransferase